MTDTTAKKRPNITKKMVLDGASGCTLAKGVTYDTSTGVDIGRTGNRVKWIAARGDIPDWCIYIQNPHYGDLAWGYDEVLMYGDKVHSHDMIQKLVAVEKEVLQMYRH